MPISNSVPDMKEEQEPGKCSSEGEPQDQHQASGKGNMFTIKGEGMARVVGIRNSIGMCVLTDQTHGKDSQYTPTPTLVEPVILCLSIQFLLDSKKGNYIIGASGVPRTSFVPVSAYNTALNFMESGVAISQRVGESSKQDTKIRKGRLNADTQP